jgi:Mg-chelatase subunit ChlD
MQSIFENSEIKFHTTENKFDETTLSGFPNDVLYGSDKFGILQFKMVNKSSTNISQTYAILLNVDCSASMDDCSRDGRTKMQHVIHTLKRILSNFAEMHKFCNANIFVSVVAFDNKIHKIFDFTKITEENLENLKDMVNAIVPLESTNIELALKESFRICHEYKKENPTHYLHHILLTDGDATEGETKHDVLSKLVNKNYPNVFIGFGKQHNAALLTCLSNDIRNDYRFIDHIEHSGIVYGEIIQNILYNIIDTGRIVVKNGLIYDWKLNQWTNELQIANLAGSCERTFQIKAEDMYEIEIDIYGTLFDGNIDNSESPTKEQLLDTVVYYPALFDLSEDMSKDITVDLSPYAFRQKTQELLYEANALSTNNNSNEYNHYENETVLKCKLKRFLKFMMNYMDKTDKKTDKFMKLLCDDIYVTYNTLGNRESSMWIHNRQSSQGKQQTYKATPSRNDMLGPLKLRRQTNNLSMTQTANLYDSQMDEVLHSSPSYQFDDTQNFMTRFTNINFCDLSQNPTLHFPSFNDSDIQSEVSNESNESIDNYELSNGIDTPYITDEIIYMMKTIGGDKK